MNKCEQCRVRCGCKSNTAPKSYLQVMAENQQLRIQLDAVRAELQKIKDKEVPWWKRLTS